MSRIAVLALSLLAPLYAQEQPSSAPAQVPETSARELFYKIADETAGGGAGGSSQPTVKPRNANLPATRKKRTPVPAVSGSPAVQPSSPAASTGNDNSTTVTVVSNRQYPPLGFKYSVLRRTEGGRDVGVDPDFVFHSGDHITLTVEVDAPGYLFVIARGASGKWSPLFPQSGNDPLVSAGRTYPINMTFTDPAGSEKLFLYLSRQRVESVEDLVLQLSRDLTNGPETTPASGKNPSDSQGTTMEALNRIDDSRVAALRQVYGRDLIVETAPSAAAHESSEDSKGTAVNSIYAVEHSGRADAHVVVDATLKHE